MLKLSQGKKAALIGGPTDKIINMHDCSQSKCHSVTLRFAWFNVCHMCS